MKTNNGNSYNIDKVLEHEYNVEEKPLSKFPDKLIKYLIKQYSLKGKILDVMCGRGEHAEAFSQNGLDAYCLDISSKAAFVYQEERSFSYL